MKSKLNISLKQQWHLILPLLLFCYSFKAQTLANVIANGSFEEYYDCNFPFALSKAKSWLSIDSSSYGGQFAHTCYSAIPINGSGFQYPRTGNAYIICGFYWNNNPRGYLKNRLKQNLQQGRTYCAKFHVNIADKSTYGIDGFGIYFGNTQIDTITYCNIPLTYLVPQVQNPTGNIISDTLNWTAITGTFIANGTEKYALIGNFKSDNTTDTLLINSTYLPTIFTDVYIDDVSCIDIDLSAYAGRDTSTVPGASVYIGRPSDVGIDEACTWYQLPNIATPIATVAGLWVNPIVTTTYVVRQQLWCSGVKWDTVVVNISPVGLTSQKGLSQNLKVYPVPAANELYVELTVQDINKELIKGEVFNSFGQKLLELYIDPSYKNTIDVKELPDGIYTLQLTVAGSAASVRKRFSIDR